jgi:hypothetical protein
VIKQWSIVAGLIVTLTSAIYAPPSESSDNMVPTQNMDLACVAKTIDSPSDRVCQTDNAGTSVYMQSTVSTNMRSRIRDALDNSYNGTDLNISYPTTPTYSGASETDIIYQQGDMPGASTIGITWCDDPVDGEFYTCDQTYIRFTTDPLYEHRALTCHETGHAVGLTHGHDAYPRIPNDDPSLGCLATPYDVNKYVLGPNNVAEINATY